jgi:hypothetical protein
MMDVSEWDRGEAGDELSRGFLEFDSEASAAFALKPIDVRPHNKNGLSCVASSEECFVMATRNNCLIRMRYNPDKGYESIPIPCQPQAEILNLYLDLVGYHCIIVTSKCEHFYLSLGTDTPVQLNKIRGLEISALAFPLTTTDKSTGDLLIGCKDGSIMQYQIEVGTKDEISEMQPRRLFRLPQPTAIYGIVYETYETLMKNDKKPRKTTLVMAVTNDTCFQFTGALPFDKLFDKYNNPAELNKNKRVVPRGKIEDSELKLCYLTQGKGDYELHSFAWKCGSGLATGEFRRKQDVEKRVVVKDLTNIGYKKKGVGNVELEIPEAVAITEHNYYYLYVDNLTVVSKITREIDHSEAFRPAEVMRHMCYDPSGKSLLLISPKSVYRLAIMADNKDLWKQQLESKDFLHAYQTCQQLQHKYTGYVAGLYADAEFALGRYTEAAGLYAESTVSFEAVVLKFLDKHENEGLGGKGMDDG